MSKTRANIILRLSSLLALGVTTRTRLKTFARIAESLRTIQSIKTDRGVINFRIDSAGSVPNNPDSERSEPETFEWIRNALGDNDVLWDVGANIGVFSLYAALEKKNTVLAIEPSAESYATLNANIRLNGLDKHIQALCLAGGKETSLLNLFMRNPSSGSSHNSIASNTNQFGEFEINGLQSILAIKLDDLCEIDGVPSPNHIKLDVDGNELDILAGAKKILSGITSILIEVEGSNLTKNLGGIEAIISAAGLEEDLSWRNKGSGRNRLYRKKAE